MLSVALLLGGLFAMFSIDLGGLTFAEHMDTISETPEAQELVEGTRSRLNPALQELRDRVLGEYVEAPTWIPGEQQLDLGQAPQGLEPDAREQPMLPSGEEVVPASGLEPALPGQRERTVIGLPPEPPLPGQRPSTTLDTEPDWEPSLPGRG